MDQVSRQPEDSQFEAGFDSSYFSDISESQLEELLRLLEFGEIDWFEFITPLIADTESMKSDERQYWFDIMPSMTLTQVEKLLTILITEKRKLNDLEEKYSKEIRKLNIKHI